MLLLASIAVLTAAQTGQVDCASSSGNTRCSQTPWGKCISTSGNIFCGDPAPEVLWVLEDPPRVTCVTSSGNGACGYDCVTSSGQAQCAQTPWGKCITTSGRIFCADPSRAVLRRRVAPPQMQCATASGNAACGYDCKTSSGKAACSSAPWGRCVVNSGVITCSPQ